MNVFLKDNPSSIPYTCTDRKYAGSSTLSYTYGYFFKNTPNEFMENGRTIPRTYQNKNPCIFFFTEKMIFIIFPTQQNLFKKTQISIKKRSQNYKFYHAIYQIVTVRLVWWLLNRI